MEAAHLQLQTSLPPLTPRLDQLQTILPLFFSANAVGCMYGSHDVAYALMGSYVL